MIQDKEGMIRIEQSSGKTPGRLMEIAGKAVSEALGKVLREGSSILILAGNGNNGGDGAVVCRMLAGRFSVQIAYVCGEPKTREARAAYRKVDPACIVSVNDLSEALRHADAIIDAVYGFSFHGPLDPEMKKLFRAVNNSGKPVYSIDLNSGCEADTGHCDSDAVRSKITYALDCYKPFHLLRKDHQKFQQCELLSLGLPHEGPSRYREMDEDLFFANFPKKSETAYKGSLGKALLISGCYGMAGAAGLNILGAETVGIPYLHAAMPEEIYAPLASRFLTPVMHPFGHESWYEVLEPLIHQATAIGFGSGAVYMDHKSQILDLILQNSKVPVVLDAEALRLLQHNTYILRFAGAPVILTPHIGEFSAISNLPEDAIRDNRLKTALDFASDYKVIVVLKGPNTIVASPSGEVYINQTGNQALAKAGSGDVLTGMMTAMLAMTRDVFTAVCMAVWLHGYLAELGTKNHSMQNFRLETYPELMDELFRKHGL
ncbi:NAD(P)H-hydrate dehydratase [Stecheria intestinalis]|uniref:NAD(P)H-hydrate dehydratase n=1 Tax=Stecheria intestinalis TaxID=2606630 RepID=UPI0023EFE59F|nr:NAD(P)H-hydrate dehydratase [Stecheria intestinalis]MCI6745458.1 NAD(P)H-hydrate dehydratase [Anaerolactibacter massiliensis]MDD5881378.1 NAD(P)H-hydrate dehydratase [Stecheria intestinalis]